MPTRQGGRTIIRKIIGVGHTGPAEEMLEAVNAGWMDLGVEGTEHVAGTRSARDVFAAAQNAAKV